MKKSLISTILLSTVILSAVSTTIVVAADDTDTKIAAQDAKIASTKSAEAAAQSEVTSIQAQVDTLTAKQAKLKSDTENLLNESKKLDAKAQELTKEISQRDESLKSQARSAQTDGAATSYVDAVVSSKSLSDAVTRISAMRTIVKANDDMLKQQEAAKADLVKTVKSNQAKVDEGYKLKDQMDVQAKTLDTRQAELKVSQLNLSVERATAEGEKSSLLDQKAAAQAAVVEAAAAEKAYNDQATASASQAASQASGGSNTPAPVNPVNPVNPVTPVTPVTPDKPVNPPKPPTPPTPSGNNTYPVGQCTWGAKVLAPWAGNNWGNGAQWGSSAAAQGYRTGSQPQVGAIASWNDGGYGHVAVVTAVQSATSIQVSEANYAGNQSIGNYRGWFNPVNAQGSLTYIYPS
ncbi:MAG: CHAP domain-containing protein [Lactococcus sp.]|nr:CHAP domain-containing protein [Lactococcus sp.]